MSAATQGTLQRLNAVLISDWDIDAFGGGDVVTHG